MKLSKLLLFTMIVGSLAVIGCGNDGGGGTAGSGGSGTAGTGGGNGAPGSTCDAICGGTCVILDVIDPNEPTCEADCAALQESYATDDCGDEMQAYLDCAGPGPDCIAPTCASLFNDWDACAQ